MQELMENKWFFWIVTGLIAAMWAALLYFIRRQRDADDARFSKGHGLLLKKRAIGDYARRMAEKYDVPINYTLRDEFLRVTTAQNTKLDKITDMIADIGADIAGIKGREKGE